ncbi:hypothetical protein KDH_23870 [Dictyobacter sp. S3.2.2.5]|uniref:Carrier domain-containing protein n=1 Tax=Dictyobacter halimunensis TaxID=3026934 RepID=A0ABQ6FMR5_9CHLR|nr:hypothetical protein KDH_23870 [Dictyobacter sp. S3.2.2.5]
MSIDPRKKQLADLTPQQRALLFQRLKEKQKQQSGQEEAAIPARSTTEKTFPLSFAQQRLWFLDLFEPGSPLYNIPLAWRVEGRFSDAMLQSALDALAMRHETLRTTFLALEGEPRQVVAVQSTVSLTVNDLTALTGADRDSRISSLIEEEAHLPFNLTVGPLLRARLLRLAEQESILLLTMHHIISDGWSGGILQRELFQLLNASRDHLTPQLPELPIQYIDFALWQRQWLQGSRLDKLLAYWKQQLADLPVLQLPFDRPRPAEQTFAGTAIPAMLSERDLAALQTLARQEGATLFMALLAAFYALLFAYTRQESIPVGSLIANRNRAETENLIGFFVNTLVLRGDVSGEPTFRELVARVREMCFDAYAHQDLPFEQLVEALHPDRHLSHSPLFQVLFTLQNTQGASLEGNGLKVRALETGTTTSKFDLALFISEQGHGMKAELEYNTDLFDVETIEGMLAHFQTLLASIAANPDIPIKEIQLLTARERRQIIDWNRTQQDYPATATLHQLFEERVTHTPDALAVRFEHQRLTYRQLDERANQLAHYLRQQPGIQAESCVGLCVERSLDMVIGLLAILKAGCSYIPLDPGYPQARIAYVLEQAGISVLLTQQPLLARLPEFAGTILCLDHSAGRIAAEPVTPLQLPVPADGLAYVIYTSGSTGLPKGVQITHHNVVNFLHAMRQQPGLTAQDVLLAVTSLSFDIAGLELFLPLTTGASLIIASQSVTRDAEELMALLREQKVTVMQATPSTWRLLIDSGWQGEPGLKILCGGEAFPPELARQLLERCHSLWNMYGPTETTIWSALQHVERVQGPVSIGRPIANTQIYILNDQLEPVPPGMPGELYIGGDGLSRGYLGKPELTAERFIPDAQSAEPGKRLYRTGDVARYQRDGSLIFLGRVDQQVKVRGYRIELHEIEAVLAQHSGVKENVVIAREDTPGESQLVAYVVAREDYQGANADGGGWQEEQIEQWQEVWDTTYHEDEANFGADLNLSGWKSSYTQQPIPVEEMREWIDCTVDRILAGEPRRVLEIGCGTGLLLYRIAPHCESYCGVDFSASALAGIQRQLDQRGWSQVRLLQRAADQLADLEAGAFDTIILNSVAQYFPGAQYFVRVLEEFTRLVAPEGRIFLGDLRSLPLLETFHTAIQLYQADERLTCDELQRLISTHLNQEEELLIDPAIFPILQRHLPGIRTIEVQLKRGEAVNEITQFRYDVTIQMGETANAPLPVRFIDWSERPFTPEELPAYLAGEDGIALALLDVPNARLRQAVQCVTRLREEQATVNVQELREELLASFGKTQCIEPERFWSLADEYPYHVVLTWARSGRLDRYDVVMQKKQPGQLPTPLALSGSGQVVATEKNVVWTAYTNNPLRESIPRKLIPEVRSYLKGHLPEYMLPAAYVLLPVLPLTPNGKIDRRALPAPGQDRPELGANYSAPRNVVEQELAQIWQQVLGIERVGIHDNFFELGGNSLLIIRVVARANKAHLPMTAKQIFKHQTIAELAETIGSTRIIAEQGVVTGPTLAAPGQRYVLDPAVYHPEYYTLAYAISSPKGMKADSVQEVVETLYTYHDALRIRRAPQDAPFALEIAGIGATIPFWRVDLADLPDEEIEARQSAHLKEQQLSFDLVHGPLFKALYFDCGEQREGMVLLLAHYLVADIESWQVLIGDFLAGYQLAVQGQPVSYPAKPTSFQQWTQRLHAYAQTEEAGHEYPYWLAAQSRQVARLPRDYPAGENTISSSRILDIQLSTAETATLLHEVVPTYTAQMDAILMTALAWACQQWSGQDAIMVRLFSHGREALFDDMDVSRTVGAFGTDFPVAISLAGAPTIEQALQHVKGQLRQIPNHGVGYGILRTYGQGVDAETLRSLPGPEIVVNYIGSNVTDPSQPIFQVQGPLSGHYRDSQSDRTYIFQVTGRVTNEQLIVQWDYSENLHARETVERIAMATMDVFRFLIAACEGYHKTKKMDL